jgi:hypothetical protein
MRLDHHLDALPDRHDHERRRLAVAVCLERGVAPRTLAALAMLSERGDFGKHFPHVTSTAADAVPLVDRLGERLEVVPGLAGLERGIGAVAVLATEQHMERMLAHGLAADEKRNRGDVDPFEVRPVEGVVHRDVVAWDVAASVEVLDVARLIGREVVADLDG